MAKGAASSTSTAGAACRGVETAVASRQAWHLVQDRQDERFPEHALERSNPITGNSARDDTLNMFSLVCFLSGLRRRNSNNAFIHGCCRLHDVVHAAIELPVNLASNPLWSLTNGAPNNLLSAPAERTLVAAVLIPSQFGLFTRTHGDKLVYPSILTLTRGH
ncbi:hypothetical protein Micbo1qcDRAFT_180686 [Microdochium bolleyi]|uniref:Uncharacterized protein n=1 Tax=Microdochium bolleyi TaxID=196109 RepID=A0A136IKZ8_9PEZI|nr:hypothetical protein Micbo1qcDRAFT_180686 [Microdochium bolleyi]